MIMRRFAAIVFTTSLLFASFASQASITPASAASLSPGCSALNGTGTDIYISPGPNTFNAGETITVTGTGGSAPDDLLIYEYIQSHYVAGYYGVPATSVSYTIPSNGTYDIWAGNDVYSNGVTITIRCFFPTGTYFGDGRLNATDAGETFALYCSSGVITVFGIDPVTSAGKLILTVTPAEIAAFPAKPTVNTAIKSGGGATLYRLSSGQLQVNRNETTGKFYAYIFNGCPA